MMKIPSRETQGIFFSGFFINSIYNDVKKVILTQTIYGTNPLYQLALLQGVLCHEPLSAPQKTLSTLHPLLL